MADACASPLSENLSGSMCMRTELHVVQIQHPVRSPRHISFPPFIFTCQLRMQSGCNDCNQCSKLHVDICWHFEFVKSRDGAQRAADSAPPHHRRAHASDQTVYKFEGITHLFRRMTYTSTTDCVLSFTAVPLSDAWLDPPSSVFKKGQSKHPEKQLQPRLSGTDRIFSRNL